MENHVMKRNPPEIYQTLGIYKVMYFEDQLVIELPPGYVAKRYKEANGKVMVIYRKRKSFMEWIKEVFKWITRRPEQ
jgi:hypothetical protein